MDFDLTDEQLELRNAVARWMEGEYPPKRRRAIAADGGFSKAVWQSFAGLGLLGLHISEEAGGLGMDAIEAMVVMEELGRNAVMEPLAQAFMVARVLSRFADAEHQAKWLPLIASGEALLVLAHQERTSRYRLDICEATANRAGDGSYTLNGTKDNVPAGDLAQAFLVPAKVDGGLCLFLVEAVQAGVKASGFQTLDGTHAASLALTDAKATLLTTEGLAALECAAAMGIAAACAEGVGVMEKALQMTVQYLGTRQQFGAPLAQLQALRHRVADMKMQVELGRSMSYYASLRLNDEADARRLAMSQAKVQLSQSMRFVGQQAVQLHGGIGVTEEYDLSFYFKRLVQLDVTFGDGLYHLGTITQMQFA
jgi:alkylation response protein AidB-like acyl-CoA dehydrogenase